MPNFYEFLIYFKPMTAITAASLSAHETPAHKGTAAVTDAIGGRYRNQYQKKWPVVIATSPLAETSPLGRPAM